MLETRLFLRKLEERVPPGEGQRHNLTIDDKGDLVLALMLGENVATFILEFDDLVKAVDEIVDEVETVYRGRLKQRSTRTLE